MNCLNTARHIALAQTVLLIALAGQVFELSAQETCDRSWDWTPIKLSSTSSLFDLRIADSQEPDRILINAVSRPGIGRPRTAYIFGEALVGVMRTAFLMELSRGGSLQVWTIGTGTMRNWDYVSAFRSNARDTSQSEFIAIFDHNWCINVLKINPEMASSEWNISGFNKPYYGASFHSAIINGDGVGRISVVYAEDWSSPPQFGIYDYVSTDGFDTWHQNNFIPLTPDQLANDFQRVQAAIEFRDESDLKDYLSHLFD